MTRASPPATTVTSVAGQRSSGTFGPTCTGIET